MTTVNDLVSTLQRSGVTQAGDLLQLLGISAPTLLADEQRISNDFRQLAASAVVRIEI